MFPLLLLKLIATLVIGYLFIAIFFTIKIFLLPLHKISCTSAKIASKLASLLSVCIIFAFMIEQLSVIDNDELLKTIFYACKDLLCRRQRT